MKKKILIVDDEKNIRISLERCLVSENYEVECACDGNEALTKLRSKNYDLILMDIQMPKKTGLQVLQQIREEGISTRAIMMTAYGTVNIAVDSMKLGAVDFISKPFTVKKVKAIVMDVINKQTNVFRIDKSIDEYIKAARDAIIKKDLEQARILLKEGLVEDTSSPEIQNLLGVIEEKSNNKQLAQKYYRAALSLDATYTPADNNLKRTVMYSAMTNSIDLG
ncbi:response regulator [Clostridium uliginosum]|uniref:Stage 0 sporulation protein A homolog n=1 Tax=Clostridium uliginosum TaxID=119641 RepID=A0A1I1KZU3_9CLOT|nr:response regulator [Clostridium uliginosum]SFC64258.1 Response regulator receiver domain-containing protein [Clostridium uliginosum]